MSIKYRVIILLSTIAIIYVAVTSQVIQRSVFPAFSSLEREFALQDYERFFQYLESEFFRLGSLNHDWSSWNDTHQFMLDRNHAYADSNLPDDAAYSLNANILMFVDPEGNLVWGQATDLGTGELLTLEDFMPMPISDFPDVYLHTFTTDKKQGFINGPGPPVAFSSLPILTNSGDGPIAGSLIMARVLDKYLIEQVKQILRVDIQLWKPSEKNPEEISAVSDKLLVAGTDVSWIESESILRHFHRQQDIYGQPLFVTEISYPRQILAIGQQTIQSAVTFLVIAIFLFMGCIWLALGIFIIKPLDHLKSHIHAMRGDEDLHRHINLSGSGEFVNVANEFNKLAVRLRISNQEIVDAKEKAVAAKNEAVAANKAKSRFLATMSHEIRTPMNGVLGMADLLLATPSLSDEQKRYAGTISHSGRALLRILNDILDFSKIEAGKFVLERIGFKLLELVEDCIELTAHGAQEKGLELVLDSLPDMPVRYLGDSGRLRQMLLNLLSNAVKYTEEGCIIVRVRIDNAMPANESVLFEVVDTGIGIRQENQSKLFNSFTQEDDSTTRRFGGTGLGLAVTRQLAELMDGEAGFDSEFGHGSRFWFRIKLKFEKSVSPLAKNKFTGSRAILCIPGETTKPIFNRQLNYWGVSVESVSDGVEACRLIRASLDSDPLAKLHFIVDETAIVNELKLLLLAIPQMYPGNAIEIIVLSPVANGLDNEALLELGRPKVIYKPVRKTSLADCFTTSESAVDDEIQSGLGQADENIIAPDSVARHVLLVDDNKINITVAETMLRKLSCQVTVANNGQEAVELAYKEEFDLVLMDCQMPVMDGYEATRKIRNFGPDHSSSKVPIIALTANIMQDDRQKCTHSGMNGFLTKPISMDELGKVVMLSA